jgi:hypothetical protein
MDTVTIRSFDPNRIFPSIFKYRNCYKVRSVFRPSNIALLTSKNLLGSIEAYSTRFSVPKLGSAKNIFLAPPECVVGAQTVVGILLVCFLFVEWARRPL